MRSMPLLEQAPCETSLAGAVLPLQSCAAPWFGVALRRLQLPVYIYIIEGLFTLIIYEYQAAIISINFTTLVKGHRRAEQTMAMGH